MNQEKITLKQTVEALRGASRVLLCTHVQPDGDAIGSTLAALSLLKAMGKDAVAICHDPVPNNLRVLPGWEQMQLPGAVADREFDLFCALDASDLPRLGDGAALFRKCPKTLVIDHHASNECFGDLNYVDSAVAATGNLVFRLFEEAGVPLTVQTATLLYAGISTDTGNFSFGQMNEEFFLQVTQLIRAGLDINTYARALHLTKELSFYKLLGRALSSLSFGCDGRMSYMKLASQDFEETGTNRDQAEGLVNYALYIPGVQMCFLATELDQNQTRFSLRALKPYNVAAIAVEFGGGGHLLAAGCTVALPIKEAAAMMQARMRKALCP